MAKAAALSRRMPHIAREDLLRQLIVGGCALALILARTTLPF